MRNNWDVPWFPDLRYGWAAGVYEWLYQKISSIQLASVSLLRRLMATTPDQWFLVGFVLMLMVFLVVLLTQPSSVGRGGR